MLRRLPANTELPFQSAPPFFVFDAFPSVTFLRHSGAEFRQVTPGVSSESKEFFAPSLDRTFLFDIKAEIKGMKAASFVTLEFILLAFPHAGGIK